MEEQSRHCVGSVVLATDDPFFERQGRRQVLDFLREDQSDKGTQVGPVFPNVRIASYERNTRIKDENIVSVVPCSSAPDSISSRTSKMEERK